MCDSKRPEHGTDSEPWNYEDHTCSYCGTTLYVGSLTQQKLGNSIAWLCSACLERDRQRYERAVAS